MSLKKIGAEIMLCRLGVAVMTLCSLACAFGVELSLFVWRNPLPQGDGLNCVAYGDGKFVAVGGFGMILTSSNALNWSVRALPAKSYLASVTYGNGAFVVNSPSEILVSTNSGVDWTELAPPVTNEFISVKFVNDRFLLGTWRGPLLSSTNGSDWERIPLSRELEFISAQAFAFGNSLYVAVGSSGVMTSADGREWVPPEISISQPFRGWASTVTFGDGQFIAAGYDGEIYGSWDGQYWEPRLEQPVRTYALMTIVYTNCCFVTAGFGALRKSADGYDWTNPTIDPEAGMHINSLVFANRKWVGVGKSGVAGYGGEIWVSTNLQEWLPQIHGSRPDLFDSAVGNGVQVVAGSTYQYTPEGGVFRGWVMRSSHGQNWFAQELPDMLDVKAIAYGNDMFVGVSMNDGSRICISSNAVDWRIIETQNHNRLSDIVFGNGRFVAVGTIRLLDSTPVVVSSNGVDWTSVTREPLPTFLSVTYGNGQFVGSGFDGDIFTSTDGLEWFNQRPVVAQHFFDLNRIVFENGEFFAMGRYLSVPRQPQRDGLLRSKDGTNWVEVTGVATAPTHLSFGNGLFVGVNTYGAVVTSEDATIWKELPQHYDYALRSCSYHDGTFYVFGTSGRILEASILPSLDISWAGQENQPILGLSGVAGKKYAVEYAAALNNSPAWTRLTNITLAGTRQILQDISSSNAPQRFYRAVLVP